MMHAVLILSEGTLGLLALHVTRLSEFLVFGIYNSYVHMKLKCDYKYNEVPVFVNKVRGKLHVCVYVCVWVGVGLEHISSVQVHMLHSLSAQSSVQDHRPCSSSI